MRFVRVAIALLGTITLVASGLVVNTPPGSSLPFKRSEFKRNIREPDESRSVSKIENQNKEQYLNKNRESLAHQLETITYQENDQRTCNYCCKRGTENCPKHCSCLEPLQDESPRTRDLASISEPLERLGPGPGNQYCSSTPQGRADSTICPYPCENECPCFDYCTSKICVLIAWEYNTRKYPCVSKLRLFQRIHWLILSHLVQERIGYVCNSFCLIHCVGDHLTPP